MSTKIFSKGFTLIELLVVITIIGILSSIVLSSLGTARNKGKDAAVKSELASMRSEAVLLADENVGSYATVCTDGTASKRLYDAAVLNGAALGSNSCNPAPDGWAASIETSNSKYWCVDSAGTSKEEDTALGASTACTP